jgi:hypothetical protein
MYDYYSHIYDFPTLLVYTLGLALMVHRRWRLFLLVVLIGCFNKETTVLLTLVFVIHFARAGNVKFRQLLGVQLLIFVVVKGALTVIFRDNPGSFVAFHLVDHNVYLLSPYELPTALAWLALALVVFHRWSEKPPFLRSAVWTVVPLVTMALFLGYLDELRGYYEAYPVVVLLASQTIANIMGTDVTAGVEEAG